ncbi:MAG: glycosyltransferase, partial [Gemmataceae bacterium]
MDGPRWSLSLVIPAYNEEAGIRLAIAEADEALSRLCRQYEILVVDDGSSDATAQHAEGEAALRPHVRVIRHDKNRGYGAALRTGFQAARLEHVAFTDADRQFHLDDLQTMLPLTEQAAVVVGYRVDRKDPWRRRFLSRGYNTMARSLLGTQVRDVDCALKVFHRDALRRLMPQSNGFFVNTEMLTRACQEGIPTIEIGVRHRPRLQGQSSVSLREVPRTLGHLLPFCWSKAWFAGGDGSSGFPWGRGFWPGLLLVMMAASLLFFSQLRAPLLEPQEGRYAEIPRQMLAEGTWLVPRLHGQDYLDKPPLFYWLVMGGYQLFGVSDWSARLVLGAVGVATVLITYLWACRVFGTLAGLSSALALLLMPGFIYRARMLTFDPVLMLWVTAGLAAAHTALTSTRRTSFWWCLSALFAGLGLLTKGPVALALIVPPVFLFACIDERVHRPGLRAWACYLGLAGLVAAPWFVAILRHDPEFAEEFFWRHHVVRFLAPFDHAKPAWYYLPGLIAGVLPWWLALVGLGVVLCDRRGAIVRQRPAALGFALLCFLWTVVFFSASGCKRPTYLLPAFPPLALAIGWFLQANLPVVLSQRLRMGASESLALVGVASAGIVLLAFVQGMVPLRETLLLLSACLGVLAVVVIRPQQIGWNEAQVAMFGAVFAGVQFLLPAYNDLFSLRGQLRRVAGPVERRGQEVVCFPQRYESVSFYLPGGNIRVFGADQQNTMIRHLRQNPGTMLLVKYGPVLQRLLEELPPDIEFQPLKKR